jgi:hypothetical protein
MIPKAAARRAKRALDAAEEAERRQRARSVVPCTVPADFHVPSGAVILAGAKDHIELLDAMTCEVLWKSEKCPSKWKTPKYYPFSGRVTFMTDSGLNTWDANTGCVVNFEFTSKIEICCINAAGTRLVSPDYSCFRAHFHAAFHAWDIDNDIKLFTKRVVGRHPVLACYTKNDAFLVYPDSEGGGIVGDNLCVVDPNTGVDVHRIRGLYAGHFLTLNSSWDGRRIVGTTNDHFAIFDIDSGKCLLSRRHAHAQYAPFVVTEFTTIMLDRHSHSLVSWKHDDKSVVFSVDLPHYQHSMGVNLVFSSRSGSLFLSMFDHKYKHYTVIEYDAATGKEIAHNSPCAKGICGLYASVPSVILL